MSKKKRKEIGWIEIFYGDFWAKRKKLIIAGLFIPFFFSFFIYLEFSLLLDMMRDTPFNLETLFYEAMARIGYYNFLILSLIVVGVSILCLVYFTSFIRFFESPLKKTCREILKEKKANPRLVLVRNISMSVLLFSKKVMYWFVFGTAAAIALVPGIILGYLIYVYFDLFSVPSIIKFVSFLPGIGENLQKIATFISETFGTHASTVFYNIPQIYWPLIFAIPVFLMLPIFDRIETRLRTKQRGNIGQILKNGFTLNLLSLNLLSKLSNFLYTTFLCLFTDQSTISIDVPVINDRNIDQAMNTILGTNQRCYVVRLPMMGAEFISEIERLPKLWQEEIKKTFEGLIDESRLLKFLAGMVKEKRTREIMQRPQRRLLRLGTLWITFAIAENECISYAMFKVPPPTYMTRMIMLLWCNDPGIKERIVEEIERLEQ